MRNLFERIREQHANIFRVVLFLLATAVIVYMFPKQAEFKYEFDAGKPWLHEDLIAPFDYAIQKSDEAIEDEKDRVREQVKPFYVFDAEKRPDQVADFEERLRKAWKTSDTLELGGISKGKKKLGEVNADSVLFSHHLETGRDILNSIFSTGIVQAKEEHEDPEQEVIFVKRNVAEEIPIDSLFNFRSAYKYAQKRLEKKDEKVLDQGLLLDLIEESLQYNVFFDEEKTQRAIEERINNISHNRGKVEKDVLIISKGDIITEGKYQKVMSLKKEYEDQLGGRKNYFFIILGQSVLVGLCMFALFIFLNLFRPEILERHTKLVFILLLIVLMIFLTKVTIDLDILETYFAPLCILPIIIRAFYDTRSAIFIHLVAVMIAGFIVPNQFEFAFLQIIAGIIVIFSIVNMRKRAQFFKSAVSVFLSYSFTYLGIALIQEGELQNIDYANFGWFGGNAMFTLFASYPMIYLFEKVFGFLSEMSLIELSDTNSPLLRQLSSNAPGTFQHSLQVADLAEEAIHEVGGDALLVRAGALYHDIGKMDAPMYFTENQTTGVNPHKDLSNEESARVIIAHVIRGIEMAKKHNLPDALIDFIRTHHGTTRVEYFFKMYKKQKEEAAGEQGEVKINAERFRYPGPLPYSKETAVLMLADSVEAASKSLKSYDASTIENLVENIINERVREEQLINAPITMKEITKIKKILKRKLMNIYHVRVEYPQ